MYQPTLFKQPSPSNNTCPTLNPCFKLYRQHLNEKPQKQHPVCTNHDDHQKINPKRLLGRINYFKNQLITPYKSPLSWLYASLDELGTVAKQKSYHINKKSVKVEALIQATFNQPVIDDLAAEAGRDLGIGVINIQKQLLAKYQIQHQALKDFSLFTRRSLIAIDLYSKGIEVAEASPDKRLKTSIIKSVELLGEGIGMALTEELLVRTGLTSLSCVSFFTPTMMIGAASMGAFIARKAITSFENIEQNKKR